MAENVVVFCAHNDDHVLGAGGTIAKYERSGIKVTVVIFSYGEKSHVWLRKNETIKMRVKESRKADKVLGVSKTMYLGLNEGRFSEEIKEKKLLKRLTDLLIELKPAKIFTHSFDDPHPDHRAVYKIAMECIGLSKSDAEVFAFDVWNPFNFRKRDSPKMVVDITSTFRQKMRSFSFHESQLAVRLLFYPVTYARAIFNGIKRGYGYAEVFYKIK